MQTIKWQAGLLMPTAVLLCGPPSGMSRGLSIGTGPWFPHLIQSRAILEPNKGCVWVISFILIILRLPRATLLSLSQWMTTIWPTLSELHSTVTGKLSEALHFLLSEGEAIRGTHGGCLSLVTICQWDKGHCYGELTGNFNNNNYSYYWRHKQFVPGMTIAKLYNSMPYK